MSENAPALRCTVKVTWLVTRMCDQMWTRYRGPVRVCERHEGGVVAENRPRAATTRETIDKARSRVQGSHDQPERLRSEDCVLDLKAEQFSNREPKTGVITTYDTRAQRRPNDREAPSKDAVQSFVAMFNACNATTEGGPC
eukprot:scaffold70768_cov52-Cyclotella_meneghiniana.AAC.3